MRNMATTGGSFLTLLRLATVASTYLGLAIFSGITGFSLWVEKPYAVRLAKVFLLVIAFVPICLMTLLRLGGVEVDLLRIIPQRLVYLLIWYSYLSKSERVRLTYAG